MQSFRKSAVRFYNFIMYRFLFILDLILNLFVERGNSPAGNYMFKINDRHSRTRYDICSKLIINPAGICLIKFNNKNTKTRCEICSKLTIKTPKRR